MNSQSNTYYFVFTKVFLAAIVFSVFAAAQNSPDDLLGEWFSPLKDGKILFFRSGGSYFGCVHWMKNPYDENGKPKVDKNNPDPSKKTIPIQNLVVFKDFSWNEEKKQWCNGRVYDPETGNTWACKLWMPDHKVLAVHGYLGISVLGRTEYLTRY